LTVWQAAQLPALARTSPLVTTSRANAPGAGRIGRRDGGLPGQGVDAEHAHETDADKAEQQSL
jgi:hypothetical protein